MYFEAEMRGKKYQIDVNEEAKFWRVRISEENKSPEQHIIKKSDYLELDGAISFLFQNSSYMVDVKGDGINYAVYTRGSFREIPIYNDESLLHESLKGGGNLNSAKALTCGMPGKIVKVAVKEGQEVKANEPLLIMEAMKMENEMRASHNVKIKQIHVTAGDSVEAGATLVSFE